MSGEQRFAFSVRRRSFLNVGQHGWLVYQGERSGMRNQRIEIQRYEQHYGVWLFGTEVPGIECF
jgi:hypothetical protein